MAILIPKSKRNAGKAWLERVNPLHGLSISDARNIFDIARAHGSPLLQKIYDEIEMTDPILATCVDRRQAALAQLGWKISAVPGADPAIAERQRLALETFVRGIGNLTEAIQHLDLALFRGFSVVQPIWQGDSVETISLLNSWNFLFDDEKRLLWNPNCTMDVNGCTEIPEAARVVQIRSKRPIDYPALAIYIRKYLGERDWGRYIERYGIPPVDVVMAPNATDADKASYVDAVDRARDGISTVWPSGTPQPSRAEASRGQDPFTPFIEHQEKLIVLRATGGTLTSLAQADTGSLAGGAQMEVWKQIVSSDSTVITDALNRSLFWRFIRLRFPNEPIAVSFELGKDKELSATEAAELAVKLKSAGYIVNQDELEEAVGFTLVRDTSPQPGGLPIFNKEEPAKKPKKERGVLEAFADDCSPVADAIKELLKDPSKEAADALIKRLPELLPEDPAMAAIIAEAMAKEFGNVEKLANSGHPYTKCPDCGKFMSPAGNCEHCGFVEDDDRMIARGKKALERAITGNPTDVSNAMYRKGVGSIDFVQGWEGKGKAMEHGAGLLKIQQKHKTEMAQIPETIAKGVITPLTVKGKNVIDKDGIAIINGTNIAILSRSKGDKWRLITHYKSDSDAKKITEAAKNATPA